MSEPKKLDYREVNSGHEFPPAGYQIDAATAEAYLKAVEESNPLYQETETVPPMTVAALAMAALSGSISFPAGTIHVSQELEFTGTVSTKDRLLSCARVSRKQDRGKLHIITIDLNIYDQKKKEVLRGKTSFIVPD